MNWKQDLTSLMAPAVPWWGQVRNDIGTSELARHGVDGFHSTMIAIREFFEMITIVQIPVNAEINTEN